MTLNNKMLERSTLNYLTMCKQMNSGLLTTNYTITNHMYLVWFCFVRFYSISSFADYLMPNPLYKYIFRIYRICKHILTQAWALFLHTVKYNSHNLTSVISLHPTKWLSNSIWLLDETLTRTTVPGQSGVISNSNEVLLHIFESSWTES